MDKYAYQVGVELALQDAVCKKEALSPMDAVSRLQGSGAGLLQSLKTLAQESPGKAKELASLIASKAQAGAGHAAEFGSMHRQQLGGALGGGAAGAGGTALAGGDLGDILAGGAGGAAGGAALGHLYKSLGARGIARGVHSAGAERAAKEKAMFGNVLPEAAFR